jgi:hypothetical protein
MTLPDEVPAVVQTWLDVPGNMDKRCEGDEKKALVYKLRELQPEKNETQAKAQLNYQLVKLRPVLQPQKSTDAGAHRVKCRRVTTSTTPPTNSRATTISSTG